MSSRIARTIRIAALPVYWIVVVGLMTGDWVGDPYPPERPYERAYGHNHDGALVDGIALASVELAVLLAILRPWSWDRSWGRTLVALALLLPWTSLLMMMSMHAGGVIVLHTLWLMTLVVALGCVLVYTVIAALVRRR